MSKPVRSEPARPKPFVPLLDYQRQDVESNDRFRWCCWSRQVGKSFTKSLRRVLRGIMRGRTQVFLSAGERQSYELMLKARAHCKTLQIASEMIRDPYFAHLRCKQLQIRLPNNVRIIGLPANPQTARGFTADVLLDEFAMHRDDRAIWAALFPCLLRGDGELDVASTPKGKHNVFYRLASNPLFGKSTVTLPEAIEQGLRVDYEQVRRSMDDESLFRQEFLCEFLDETTALLSYERIANCEEPHLAKAPDLGRLGAMRGDLFAGVDVGRRRDLTVIWLLERDGEVLVTRGVVELSNVPFRDQYERLGRFLALRALRRCCIDAGGLGMQLAEAAVEDFGAHKVEPVTMTGAVKSQLAGALRIRVEDGSIRIPVDEAIRNDWHSVRRTVTAAGHIRFDAERTAEGHGDRFWAAALAVHAAEQGSVGPAEHLRADRLRFARCGIW